MAYRVRPTGRATETREIPPDPLDCGHPYTPGRVIVSYNRRPGDEHGERFRTYVCRECGHTTYSRREGPER